jgi:hypothetical protein
MYEGVGGHAGCSKDLLCPAIEALSREFARRGGERRGSSGQRRWRPFPRGRRTAVLSNLLFFQIGLGRVWAGLLEGWLMGLKTGLLG